MKCVLAVDDAPANDSIYRDALAGLEDIDYLGQITFEEAMARPSWADVHTVLLDLGDDETSSLDRFTGCSVAQRIRALHPRESDRSPTIIVLTQYSNLPGVRARASEAGVDYWYRRGEVTWSHDRLRDAVREPRNRPPVEDIDVVRERLGLKPGVTINDAARGLNSAVEDTSLTKRIFSRTFGGRSAHRSKTDRVRGRMGTYLYQRNIDKNSNLWRTDGGENPTLPQILLFAGETMQFPPELADGNSPDTCDDS